MTTFAAHPATCALLGCARPVWPPHDYCGRTHAQEALGAIAPPHGSCHVCRLSGCGASVAFDAASGRVHDYCGRAHAQEALERGERDDSLRALQGRGTPNARCSLPGCSAPRYVDEVEVSTQPLQIETLGGAQI